MHMDAMLSSGNRILVVATNVGDLRLITDLLSEEFDDVDSCSDVDTAINAFGQYRPQVMILAFKSLEESERFYLGLYRRNNAVHEIPHRTIVLCHRSELPRAFELCRKRHFDDYVAFWPAGYEPQRLKMAVLLAARASASPGGDMPSPKEFAAQARRMVEIESLLERKLALGGERIGQFGESLAQAQKDVQGAVAEFSRRVLERDQMVHVKDRAALDHELDRLLETGMREPLAAASAMLDPVRQWVGSFGEELAPQLESMRALSALASRVRPVVLVVDDDPFQHRLLRGILADVPVELDFANSGTEALALLRHRRPELMLMDFNLPDVSGVDILHMLKSLPAMAGIPTILITGTSTKEVLQESLKAGAVDFMAKPFDKTRLVASISRLLDLSTAAGSTPG